MPDASWHSGGSVAFSFPAEPNAISEVRRLIVMEAKTLPFTEDDLADIELAVSEAFTNMVQYAPGFRVRGICSTRDNALEIRFEIAQNISRYLDRRQFPAGLSHRGRGIPLLNHLIPIVEVEDRGGGKWELRLKKPAPEEAR